jgi:phosphoenolpyruvate-protein phosphotransferase
VSDSIVGLPAAPGIAMGPVWRYHVGVGVPGSTAAEPSLAMAARVATERLRALAADLRALGRPDEAGILEAQALIAIDPALLDDADRRIALGESPDAAIRASGTDAAARLTAAGDPLIAARAADVLDVADRVARLLTGAAVLVPERPSIAVADDLPPSVLAELPGGLLLGVALEGGSPTAHAAILARARGVPAVVGLAGLGAAVDAAAVAAHAAADATAGLDRAPGVAPMVYLDGDTGSVLVASSDEELLEAIAAARGDGTAWAIPAHRVSTIAPAEVEPAEPCATADGWRILLAANIGRPEDAVRALAAGAEGVGLFRTETLFLGRAHPPSEQEQRDAYRGVMAAFGPDRPVVIRLADIGGDKSIPYVVGPAEANPFLGVRGIRMARRDPRLYLTQLRAIATAAAATGSSPWVMAPMVATLADVELFRELRDDALASLRATGVPASSMHLGAMVEVPSAALMAEELARRVAFLSIGTNDLTQYTLAADRGNAALADLQDALHPAVLRLVRITLDGAAAAGIPVAVCGELAGDPDGALVLVGLGVHELSVDPASLQGIRSTLATVRMPDLRALADAALRAPDARTVRRLAAELRSG